MPNFYLTFGVQYFHEPHPLEAGANPNGYVLVDAFNELRARQEVQELIGDKWSMLYSEDEFLGPPQLGAEMRTVDYFPDGCSGTIRDGEFTLAE